MSGAPASPDWQQRILDAMDASATSNPGRRSVGIVLSADELRILREAARRRDISLGSFVRRCALSFAIHDLELDRDVVFANEQNVKRFATQEMGRSYAGRGFGAWIITELREP